MNHAFLAVQPELLAVSGVPHVGVVHDHPALETHQHVGVSRLHVGGDHLPDLAAEEADEIQVVHGLLHDCVVRQEVVRPSVGGPIRT